METKKLRDQLNNTFSEIIIQVEALEEVKFFHKLKNEKWSVAEILQHLTLSIFPINNLLSQPELLITRWGHSNRNSKEMDVFLIDYNKATSGQEWKAFPPFVPKTENENQNYQALHYTSHQSKIDDFYNFTGEQIVFIREKFQIDNSSKQKDLIEIFRDQSELLLSISKNLSDSQMDDIQLPLPYIGLVTFREVLYFTLDHCTHHYLSINNLS